MFDHFSQVATSYNDLRATDLEPIMFIKGVLDGNQGVEAADIGCGAGRYCLRFLEHLNIRYLTCIDSNESMLKETLNYLRAAGVSNFKTIMAGAEEIPLADNSMDCLFAFNAIHHFNLMGFLESAAKALRDGGRIFIYTRLRSQNVENIWGRYFPLFLEKENRLYELSELEEMIKSISPLSIDCVRQFKYRRIASLSRLVRLAKSGHYSTFSLYSRDEFEAALNGFQKSVRGHFNELGRIEWFDENTLLVLCKGNANHSS